ncbi:MULTISPECIES: phosphatase PAP2 family protein [Streptomyces]|uniref:Phosphatase PAP2 family protein n=2 Tax=Streptomyces TaxID=1883 RepID=A0ABS9JF21_9ACTN|nr:MULTISPECIES: phosphatase PAP2 family protein [Streptomyces]MCG0064145.1 phosphatase PAP2 family protein [Streptomyces tricolor]OYP18447.1 PAP2 family protein [Streptomyces sp. FBKL.4005]BCM65900.1 putative integral membrane protein [Streptomyces sp. EAS-AB2608]CUW27499.1 PAP2 superfamily protein [Streptomyces reticuli]
MRTERNLTRRLDRVFARLDREPERPAHIDVPRMSRHRVVLFSATLAFYLAIVWAVVTTSWLVRLDWQVMFFRPYQQWPEIHAFLDYYVVLGQRGPTAVMVAAWLGWRSWRQHTVRPLLTLATSLLLLNVTVGAAKIGMGRLGPHYATVIGSNEMGLGGDIFPSGHTANAVVTWGILAYLASTPRARRWLSALSAVTSLGVGLTTVYLGTHWLSDVLLGWAAGLLILLALPWFEPLIAKAELWLFELRDRWRARRGRTAPEPAVPVTPVVLTARGAAAEPEPPAPAREPVSPTRASRGLAHLAPGPHTARSERTPVTPAGSRRPPHADRLPHTDRLPRGTSQPARPLTGG